MRRSLVTTLLLIGLGCGGAGCGGEGIPAPTTIAPDEDTGCPAASDALAHTKVAFQGDAVARLRPHMTRILVEDGGLRVVMQGLSVILAGLDQNTFDALAAGIKPETGLGGLTKHMVEILRYIDGSSEHLPGEHLDVMAGMHAILSECEAATTLDSLSGILELDVDASGRLVPAGTGASSWMFAVLEAARVAVADPEVAAVIESIELEDEESGGGIRLGREAFQLLVILLGKNLAAPDFDPDYSRDILTALLVDRLATEESRARMIALLDVMLLITEPTADVFPQTQALMGCVAEADDEAAIAGMIYDWLTVEQLPMQSFLDDLSSSTNTPVAIDLRFALSDVVQTLEAEPRVASDMTRVMAAFVDAATAPDIVKALLGLQGQGVLTEVTSFAGAIRACRATSGPRSP